MAEALHDSVPPPAFRMDTEVRLLSAPTVRLVGLTRSTGPPVPNTVSRVEESPMSLALLVWL